MVKFVALNTRRPLQPTYGFEDKKIAIKIKKETKEFIIRSIFEIQVTKFAVDESGVHFKQASSKLIGRLIKEKQNGETIKTRYLGDKISPFQKLQIVASIEIFKNALKK